MAMYDDRARDKYELMGHEGKMLLLLGGLMNSFFSTVVPQKLKNSKLMLTFRIYIVMSENPGTQTNLCTEKEFHVKISFFSWSFSKIVFYFHANKAQQTEVKLNWQKQKLWCIKRVKRGAAKGANEKWLWNSERQRETLMRHDMSNSGQIHKCTVWYKVVSTVASQICHFSFSAANYVKGGH